MTLQLITGPCFGSPNIFPGMSLFELNLFIVVALLTIVTYVFLRSKSISYPNAVVVESESEKTRVSYPNQDILMQEKSALIDEDKLPFINFSPKVFYSRALGLFFFVCGCHILFMEFFL